MKIKSSIFYLLLIVFTLSACKKDEKTPAELLEGRWQVSNSNFFGTDYPGDGSYLEFTACSSSCSGLDYMAGDNTTGVFTYSMNEAGTEVSIVDSSTDGGSWNGLWDVLELDETVLKITTSTMLGNMTVTFHK